jgi:hypothetical protein
MGKVYVHPSYVEMQKAKARELKATTKVTTIDDINLEDLAVIIDKEAGLIKYGEKRYVEEYLRISADSCRKLGVAFIVENWVLVDFSRYFEVLSEDELRTFINYMMNCSSNGARILETLNMSAADMKDRISKMKDLGY